MTSLPSVFPHRQLPPAAMLPEAEPGDTRTGALLTPDEALALLSQQTAPAPARRVRPELPAAGSSMCACTPDRRARLSPTGEGDLIRAEQDVRGLGHALELALRLAVEAHTCVPDTLQLPNSRPNVHELNAHGEDAQKSPSCGAFLERWLVAARENIPDSSGIASSQSDAARLDSENDWNECDVALVRLWLPCGTRDGEDVCRRGKAEHFIRAGSDLTVGTQASSSSVISAVSSVESQSPIAQRRLRPSR